MGPCYNDQTHILTSYVTYQLPLGRGKQFGHDMNPALNAVLGNWEIGGILTVHSGNALTLNEFGGWGIGGDTSHTGGIEPFTLSGRPNCSGPIKNVDRTVLASGNTPGYIQWFDTSNISDPARHSRLLAEAPSLTNFRVQFYWGALQKGRTFSNVTVKLDGTSFIE